MTAQTKSEPLTAVMDHALSLLNDGKGGEAVYCLVEGLYPIRNHSSLEEWRSLGAAYDDHPVIELLMEDPYTRRARTKPRGYAGDAVMLDYVYGFRDPEPETTSLGRSVFEATTQVPIAKSVTDRLHCLAAKLDVLAARKPGARVVCIGCGHMRELSLTSERTVGALSQIVALDQDRDSLAFVNERGFSNVRTLACNISRLLAGRIEIGSADLIYAAGLFDYLSQRTAQCLVDNLFNSLVPDGELYVANLMPNQAETAYMEFVDDWWMKYRTIRQMSDLAGNLSPQVAVTDVKTDVLEKMAFLSCKKI